MSDTNNSTGGVTTAGLLGVLFIGLKLGHVIDWPWLWVLAPFWIPVAVMLALGLVAAVILGLVKVGENIAGKKAEKRRQARRNGLR